MGSLFSKPKIPKPPAPIPMVDEESLRRAKKRAVTRVRTSGGRDSTVLGDIGGTDTLGS